MSPLQKVPSKQRCTSKCLQFKTKKHKKSLSIWKIAFMSLFLAYFCCLTFKLIVLWLFQVDSDSNRFNKFIQEIGILSLGIYTCHLTLMDNIVKSLRFIIPFRNEVILIILGFTICGFISLVIVNLLKKKEITARFFLGK